MNLYDYKDILGKPNEGFHSKRINILGLSVASNDFYGTFFLSFILTLFVGLFLYLLLNLKLNIKSFFIYWISMYIFFTIFMFIFGIFLHRLFTVNTELNKIIFGII
jgi:hypothetical protein